MHKIQCYCRRFFSDVEKNKKKWANTDKVVPFTFIHAMALPGTRLHDVRKDADHTVPVCRAASAASTEPRAVASVAAILAVERIVRDANSWRVVNIVGIGSQEAFENARKQRFRHHQNWLSHVPT